MGQLVRVNPTMWSRVAVSLLLFTASCHAGLLGAGTGEGSCRAAPFRAAAVAWPQGCPASAPCCSEYGYCQSRANWQAGAFRDCNGASNGTPLPADAINAENAAAAGGDTRGLPLLGVPTGVAGSPAAGGFGVPGAGGFGGRGAGAPGAGGFGAGGFGAGGAGAPGAGGFGAGGSGAGAGGFGAGGFGAGGAGGAGAGGFGAGGAGNGGFGAGGFG